MIALEIIILGLAITILDLTGGAVVAGNQSNNAKNHWFEQRLGREVVLEGTALNAKLGATLATEYGDIWIDGLDAWPEGYFYRGRDKGERVRVKGKVIKRSDLPVFIYNSGDPLMSGIPIPPGTDIEKAKQRYLLSGAKWDVIKKPSHQKK